MRTHRWAAGTPEVSVVGVGTSPLGGNPRVYGYDVAEKEAVATVRRALSSSIRFLDTSNEYGGGESERRIGAALREAGGLPGGFVIATKADPAPGATDFTGERVRESFEESAQRLGTEHFDVFHLHDPDRFEFETMIEPGGAVDAMVALKEEGRVRLIGVAGGSIDEMRRYIDTGVFDIVLNHNHYTLLEQDAEPLIEDAISAGVIFINAAPYASGMLAKPAEAHPRYRYREPNHEVRERTELLRALCAPYDVPLAAMALQFSTRDDRIASTIVGVSSPERVDALERNEELTVPQDLWFEVAELLGFVPRAAKR